MKTARLVLCLALGTALAAPALAHEAEYAPEVEQRAGRVAVRFRSAHGGAPLAGGWVQVFAPGDERAPREEGRTDAAGLFEFRPTAPGTWRVRAVDATGHGAVASVEVASAGAAAPAAPAPRGEAPGAPARGTGPRMRVLSAAATIVLAFVLLAAFHRRRRRA